MYVYVCMYVAETARPSPEGSQWALTRCYFSRALRSLRIMPMIQLKWKGHAGHVGTATCSHAMKLPIFENSSSKEEKEEGAN